MRLFVPRPRLSARLRRLAHGELGLVAVWASAVLVAETLGRRSPSDAFDTLGVFGLVVLVTWTALVHARTACGLFLPLVVRARALWRAVRRAVRPLRWRIAIDLRGTPAIRAGLPRALRLFAAAAALLCLLLASLRAFLPEGLRQIVHGISPTIWFLLLGSWWSALCVGALALLAVPVFQVREHWRRSLPGARALPIRVTLGLLAGYLALFATAVIVVPPLVPLTIALTTIALVLALLELPGTPRLSFCWRSEGSPEVVASDWTRVVQLVAVLAAALATALVLLSQGAHLTRFPLVSNARVTVGLGRAFVWAFAFAVLAEAWTAGCVLWRTRGRDPSRPVPTLVDLRAASGDLVAARAACAANGWRLFAPGATDPLSARCAVPVQVDETARRDDWRWSTRWPLAVATDDLRNEEFIVRVARRDEILRRRQLLRGLERLFAIARARRYERGQGFWLAAHLWAVRCLERDADDGGGDIGPPYHTVLPLAARAHWLEVLRGTQVDLLFVEDGVTFRRLRRVFVVLFELHDVFGGRRRAEELHFRGLPGLRVLLHEFTPDSPGRVDRYPEPDYGEFARARILHVFRDRGEDGEAGVRSPTADRVPDRAPVLV